jgi:hypothetical protein
MLMRASGADMAVVVAGASGNQQKCGGFASD